MSGSRYNSFEDRQMDVQFATLERRVRNLESLIGTGRVHHNKLVRFFAGAPVNVTSTTYEDVTGFSASYQKLSSTSWLRIDLRSSGLVSVTNTEVDFGVSVTGSPTQYTNQDVADFNFDDVNVRHAFSNLRYIPDSGASPTMEAGLLLVQVRVKVNANQFTYDNDDVMSLEVSEVLPS